MDVKKIIMPDGKMRTYFRGDDQTWADVIQTVVLPDWQEYCNDHWIDYSNHESMWSFEKRTKAFLDRVAWLILSDDPGDGIESNYKAMSHLVTEIPASECPPDVSDQFYSQRTQPAEDTGEDARFENLMDKLDSKDTRPKRTPKKKKIETRFDRISRICREYPSAKRTWCCVDADNCFEYDGREYRMPYEVYGYSSENERMDSMDRVLVVDINNGDYIILYDQNVYRIEQAAELRDIGPILSSICPASDSSSAW